VDLVVPSRGRHGSRRGGRGRHWRQGAPPARISRAGSRGRRAAGSRGWGSRRRRAAAENRSYAGGARGPSSAGGEEGGGAEERERDRAGRWFGGKRSGWDAASPGLRNGGGAAAKCSRGCRCCWSPYSSRGCCILGMQHGLHLLLETVLRLSVKAEPASPASDQLQPQAKRVEKVIGSMASRASLQRSTVVLTKLCRAASQPASAARATGRPRSGVNQSRSTSLSLTSESDLPVAPACPKLSTSQAGVSHDGGCVELHLGRQHTRRGKSMSCPP
jgi:hypothetical protein